MARWSIIRIFITFALFLFPISRSVAGEWDPSVMPPRSALLTEFKKRFHKPIEQFFEDRNRSPQLAQCRKALATRQEQYRKAFREASTKEDFDALEEILEGDLLIIGEAWDSMGLVQLLQSCGPCVSFVKQISFKVYESDGWCRMPNTVSPEQKFRSYQASVKRLLNLDAYPKRNKGFLYMMEFKGIDPQSGGESHSTASPFLTYISVKALFNTALGYLAKIFHQEFAEPSTKLPYFVMQFARVDAPNPTWVPGDVYDFPKLVGDKPLSVIELPVAQGRWLADADGNESYFTRANFGKFSVPGMEGLATRVLMETLWNLHDSVREAK